MRGVIYKYTNTINGKVYIGQTIREAQRKIEHERYSRKSASYFHIAIKKYGYNSFLYEVLFIIEDNNKEYIRDILNFQERHFIKLHSSNNRKYGYNLTVGGDGVVGNTVSESSKRKISISKKGIKWTQSQKETFSKARTGLKYNWKKSPGIHSYKKVAQYTKDGILVKVFNSLKEASNFMKCPSSTISVVCHNQRKSALGFVWKLI